MNTNVVLLAVWGSVTLILVALLVYRSRLTSSPGKRRASGR
jgi:hypothetical protein